MARGAKKPNMGRTDPITTCSGCSKQWIGSDNRTLRKLFKIHMKLEHPNAVSTLSMTRAKRTDPNALNVALAEQLVTAKDIADAKLIVKA